MIKFSRVDDIYFFDEMMSIPGVRDGYIQRAAEGDQDFVTITDDDGFQGVFMKGDDGRLIGVGPAIQVAAGPTTTMTDTPAAAILPGGGTAPAVGNQLPGVVVTERRLPSDEPPLRINIRGVGQPTMPEEVEGQPSILDEFVSQGGMTLPADAQSMTPAQMGRVVVDGLAGIARGGVKGTLGFGGDVEQFFDFIGRFATDRQGGGFMDRLTRAAQAFESPTLLPTSQDIERSGILPPTIPAGATTDRALREKAAAGGEFAGGFLADPLLAVKAAKVTSKAVREMAEQMMSTAPVGAITVGQPAAAAAKPLAMTNIDPQRLSVAQKIVKDGISANMSPTKMIQAIESQTNTKLTGKQQKELKQYVSENTPKGQIYSDQAFKDLIEQPFPFEPSTQNFTRAFDDAINWVKTLDPANLKNAAMMADQRLAPILGTSKDGKARRLLTTNGKLLKTETGVEGGVPIELPDGRNIESAGLAISPAFKVGKFSTCPNSASCAQECLGKTSGGYFAYGGGADLEAMKGTRLRSFRMTQAMFREPEAFAIKLNDEIMSLKKAAAKNGNALAIRLNVLSDIDPKVYKSIIEANPDVLFYDYTKMKYRPVAPNHHYTYSSTGLSQKAGQNGLTVDVENPHSNWVQMRQWLDEGQNVAMAFSSKKGLPTSVLDEATGKVYRVIDGDAYDFRPMDAQPAGMDGVIVGLKNKAMTRKESMAAQDSKGFFVQYDPKLGDQVTIPRQKREAMMLKTEGQERPSIIETGEQITERAAQ